MKGAFTALFSLLLASTVVTVQANSSDRWYVALGPMNMGGLGISLGVTPDGTDNPNGVGGLALNLSGKAGGFCLERRENGVGDWVGETGFYGSDYRAPLLPGQSMRWDNLYLWAQDYTPTSANLGRMFPQFGVSLAPPPGYRAHLVLDYVPDSCNWTGGPDVWVNDLSVTTTFALPIPVVTDPLQGTQFHIDVYAPAVPEPSSLAALLCGLVGVGGVVVRRRRRSRWDLT